MEFRSAAIVFGVCLVLAGVVAWVAPRRWPNLWRVLPRERLLGGVIGVIGMIWGARLVQPMLEGGLEGLRVWVLPVCVGLAIASAFLIDYVMCRALAGLLLLTVNWLLHASFVAHAPARPLLSVVLYILGVAGILMFAYPYRFRDLLEKLSLQARWRHGVAAALLALGLVTVCVAVATHG